MEIKLLEVKAAEADLRGKLDAAKREFDVKHAEVEALLTKQKEQEIYWQARKEEIRILRGSDKGESLDEKITQKDNKRNGRKK